MTRVLFVCTHNSARSQMAEALLRLAAGGQVCVFSAGTNAGVLHPLAVKAMREVGIDISRHRAKPVEEYAGRPFDFVITVCDDAKEACPVFPGGATRLHWSLPDPSTAGGSEEQRMQKFRAVRDTLSLRVRDFLQGDLR